MIPPITTSQSSRPTARKLAIATKTDSCHFSGQKGPNVEEDTQALLAILPVKRRHAVPATGPDGLIDILGWQRPGDPDLTGWGRFVAAKDHLLAQDPPKIAEDTEQGRSKMISWSDPMSFIREYVLTKKMGQSSGGVATVSQPVYYNPNP